NDYESLMPAIERKFQVPNAVIPGVFTRERPFMGKGCTTCCPESEQEVPPSLLLVFPSFQEVPPSFQEVPTSLWGVPLFLREVSPSLREVSTSLRVVPTSLQVLPTSLWEAPLPYRRSPFLMGGAPFLTGGPLFLWEVPLSLWEVPSSLREVPPSLLEVPPSLREEGGTFLTGGVRLWAVSTYGRLLMGDVCLWKVPAYREVSVEGVSLWEVSVEGVCLWEVSVEGVCLWEVSVECVCLWEVSVEGVCLWELSVEGVCLWEVSMECVCLSEVSVEGVCLWEVSVECVCLSEVSVEGVCLWEVSVKGVFLWEVSVECVCLWELSVECVCLWEVSVSLFYTDTIPSKGLHNILNMAVYTKQNLFKRTFCHIVFIWNCDIGLQVPCVKKSVLNSDRVKNCILNSVYQDSTNGSDVQKVCELEKVDKARQKQVSKLNRKAKGIINKMAAGIYRKLVRFTGWFLFKLFGRLLDSIQLHKGQIQMVQQAAEENKPLVFLPLHKSHLDYILVTYVLLTCDIKAPHVAAGGTLTSLLSRQQVCRMKGWQSVVFLVLCRSWLMRHLGGFFIKRKLDHASGKDDLYKSILQEYVQQLLANEQYLEIFIEGSRSRTGKAMVPKSGLLSVVVNAVIEGVVPDVMIVPVNISYEKLFETSYSRELLGEPKRPETFLEAVKGIWEVFGACYGNIRIDFSRPFSLKELSQSMDCSPIMQEFGSDMVARSSVTSTPASSMLRNYSDLSLSDFGEEQCFMLTKVLGYHVIYDAVQCSAVMSTNMMAFILLYIYRNGATLDQLIDAFEELRKEIVTRGRDVGFSGKIADVVHHALDMLKDLVEVQQTNEQTFIKPCLGIPHIIDLLLHSNLVCNIACSICAVAKERDIDVTDIEQEQTLPQSMIIEKAKDLCELLQKEFIFAPPCVSLETRLVETLDTYTSSEIIKCTSQ
ncbi:hypothetical protein QZH41_018056, partial [Actinostola sp. cb2023]